MDNWCPPAGSPVQNFVLSSTKGLYTSEIVLFITVAQEGATPAAIHELPKEEADRGY